MRRFKYRGDGPVDVDVLGLTNVTPNTIVEVEDTDLADSMDDSPSWEHVPDPERSKAAKKAAATRADSESEDQ